MSFLRWHFWACVRWLTTGSTRKDPEDDFLSLSDYAHIAWDRFLDWRWERWGR